MFSIFVRRWRNKKPCNRKGYQRQCPNCRLALLAILFVDERINLTVPGTRVTFLRNHQGAIGAMDFLVVPTARFRLLYVWFVIGHGRREILRINVTAHPTAAWVVQQLRETFPGDVWVANSQLCRDWSLKQPAAVGSPRVMFERS